MPSTDSVAAPLAARVSAPTVALAAAMLIGAALLASPWFGHFDDTDAQLYLVVARKMAASRSWLDPSYLHRLYPHYREHLPFGIWPFAAADLLAGESGARAVAAFFSLCTLAWVAAVARALLGRWPAVAAVLVLALTESFFRYGGATRLDPLLMLLASCAATPALLGSRQPRHWVFAAALAALAVLVKGPFGLVPFVAAGGARALADRSARPLVWTMAGALAAAAPLGLFLAADRRWLHAGWWEGYLLHQLIASAEGLRPDGRFGLLAPLPLIAGRFWPGLPLVALGIVLAFRRDREARLLCSFCALMLAELCLPARKVWNHELVAYPGLALLAAAGARPLCGWLEQRPARAAAMLAAAAALACAGAPALGRAMAPECVEPAAFARSLDLLRPGDEALVVSSPPQWRMIASLAAERRLEPAPLDALPEADAALPSLALVQEPLWNGQAHGWREQSRAAGWVLLRKQLR